MKPIMWEWFLHETSFTNINFWIQEDMKWPAAKETARLFENTAIGLEVQPTPVY
jgi:hypothetical protein